MIANDQCIIRMSEQAIISMALNGIEAYSIKHAAEGELRLETCGALFGYEVCLPDGRILYQIEMANVDTSAGRLKSSVSPNPLAMKRKANIMSQFWPHLKYIGDYHTHPYRTRADVFSVKKKKVLVEVTTGVITCRKVTEHGLMTIHHFVKNTVIKLDLS